MKFHHLLFLVVFAFLVAEAFAGSSSKRKVRKGRRRIVPIASESNPDAENEISADDDVEVPEEPEQEIRDNRVPILDPCTKVHCGAGRICSIDEDGEPQCVCIDECPVESESRRRVCSNHNETWTSDCSVYQQRCWCETGDQKCRGPDYRHIHIEYYGECREMPKCTEEEMADFPRRMRDWLFNIMRDLADRKELTPHYLEMQREAETNLTRRWTNAAIWKWCDLDGHPHDRSVSRHELFPIRAPLMSLEHCIAPFLDSCDTDDNHRISLDEWGTCLQLKEDDLEDRCDQLVEG